MPVSTICRRRYLPVALLFAAIAVRLTAAIAAPPTFDEAKLAAIKAGMQKFVDQREICGAVVVVGTSQGIVHHDTVGNQSLDSAHPMPKNAIFRIMSMTKPITAMGVMMLADEGKLAVDDPVEKHLPEFKGQMLMATNDQAAGTVTLKKPARPVTLRDLFTHTAGLAGYPPGLTDLMRKRHRTLAEVVAMTSQRPLKFEPGSKWEYSQTGLDTLGRIIEIHSGKSYEEFLDERIFQPLGMRDTAFYLSPKQTERLAQLCALRNGELAPVDLQPGSLAAPPTEKPKFPSPAGGLYSTAADLARLYQALLCGGQLNGRRFISEQSLRTMTQTQTGDLETGFTPGMSWGLGCCVVKTPQGVTEMLSPGAYGHGGAFGTQGWIDPTKDVFLILLLQRTGLRNADGSDVRREFQSLALQAIKP